MTVTADIPLALPDLDDLDAAVLTDPGVLDEALARVLPECPPETVRLDSAFASSI